MPQRVRKFAWKKRKRGREQKEERQKKKEAPELKRKEKRSKKIVVASVRKCVLENGRLTSAFSQRERSRVSRCLRQ
jgi:hypothetical protein